MSGRDALAAALRHAAAVPDTPPWRQRMEQQADVILAAAPNLIVTTEAELTTALAALDSTNRRRLDPRARAEQVIRAIREGGGLR